VVHGPRDLSPESATTLAPSADPLDLLTDRQLAVLMLVAVGRTVTATATVLGISRETVYVDLRAARAVLRRTPHSRWWHLCTVCRVEPRLRWRRVGRLCYNERRRESRHGSGNGTGRRRR
jgi:hypothetical protein